MDSLDIQRTLVLLKPDAVQRGLMGRIVGRFEDALLKVVGVKMVQMDAEFTRRHYADLKERLGSEVYNLTAGFMQSGPVVALCIEGVEAIATVRKLIGTTYPAEATPGTLRGDYAHQTKAYAQAHDTVVANLVHASGNLEEAKAEVELWFDPSELHAYETLSEKFAR